MLSDARSCGSYSDEYNYDYGKDQMPQGGRKEAEGNYGKGSDGQEENWARIELSTNKLYKYRKYDVRLFVKKSMRIRSGVSEIDILKSLLSAKCFCEGTRSEPFCNKCHAQKVVSLDTAKNTQNIKVDRGEYEIYTCVITSKCSSSRDHIHAPLVLVVDGYPFTRSLISTPFGLFSREKKVDKKQPIIVNEQQINVPNNEPLGYNFGYNEVNRENEVNRIDNLQKNAYPEYPTGPNQPTLSSAKNFTEYLYETSSFIGMESAAISSSSVAMPTESFDSNAMFDYDNYSGSYVDTGYTQTKEQLQPQQKYLLPPSLPQQMPQKEAYNEPNDDFRFLMPEYFVSSIQQKYFSLGPPPGNPNIVGTGEGAPDPTDCL